MLREQMSSAHSKKSKHETIKQSEKPKINFLVWVKFLVSWFTFVKKQLVLSREITTKSKRHNRLKGQRKRATLYPEENSKNLRLFCGNLNACSKTFVSRKRGN